MTLQDPKLRIEGAGRVVDTTLSGLQGMARAYRGPSAEPLPAGLGPDDLYPAPRGRNFKNDLGDESQFIPAPDLEELAEQLIEEWPEMGFLESLRLRFLRKQKGTTTAMGKATKVSGFWPALVGIDVVIWLGAQDVRDNYFTVRQVKALLYHELCHVGVDDETGKALIIPHDAELFFMELRRYGVWRQDYRRFGQLSMDGHLAQGEGLTDPKFGACRDCGATIILANPCPSCAEVRSPRACTSWGRVLAHDAPPLVAGVCVECRAETPLGRDEGGDE